MMFAGSVVAVLLCGYELQCFDNGVSQELSLKHNERMIRELCCQAMIRITSKSLQQRVFDLHQGSNQDTAVNIIHRMDIEEPLFQEAHAPAGARSASLWRTRRRPLAEPPALRPLTTLHRLGHHGAGHGPGPRQVAQPRNQAFCLIGKLFSRQLRGDMRAALSTTLEDTPQGQSSPQTPMLTPAHSIKIIRDLYPSHQHPLRYQ